MAHVLPLQHRTVYCSIRLLFLLVVYLFLTTPVFADNVIQIENAKLGTTQWQLTNPAKNREIEGYASLTSVTRGGQISLFVNTAEPSYTIEVFRMGSYGGLGARRMTDAITLTGIQQFIPVPDQFGLIDCNWGNPFVLTIPNNLADPTDWASGVYLAKLTAGTSGKQSYIIFVVRDDARASDYLFQSSVTTFQAYNDWGGASLYNWPSGQRSKAVKVSFNRPYHISNANPDGAASGVGAGEFLTNVQPPGETSPAGFEYNMVRFLEREGYDVTYCTDVDTHADPNLLLSHKAFLSVGHDEYWSWDMRAHVEAARDQGVSLGFFSSNTCYWQIRFENSPVTGAPNRTVVCYKGDGDDPEVNNNLFTTQWRALGRWEDSLIGVAYQYDPVDVDVVIINAAHWICANTGLNNGDPLTGLVGYEADSIFGHAPANLEHIGMSPFNTPNGTKFSDLTVYTAPSGATVFATGTMKWSWGMDNYNAVNTPAIRTPLLNAKAQQMTRNVLARFSGLPTAANPIDQASYFVRMHYHDFLIREPDQSGWSFWTGQITQCGSDQICVGNKRVDVSRAYFYSAEFIALHPELAESNRGTHDYNVAFVKQCYYAYLLRTCDPAVCDPGGLNFWVNKLDSHIPTPDGDYTEMIRAFITSIEYRARFGKP